MRSPRWRVPRLGGAQWVTSWWCSSFASLLKRLLLKGLTRVSSVARRGWGGAWGHWWVLEH